MTAHSSTREKVKFCHEPGHGRLSLFSSTSASPPPPPMLLNLIRNNLFPFSVNLLIAYQYFFTGLATSNPAILSLLLYTMNRGGGGGGPPPPIPPLQLHQRNHFLLLLLLFAVAVTAAGAVASATRAECSRHRQTGQGQEVLFWGAAAQQYTVAAQPQYAACEQKPLLGPYDEERVIHNTALHRTAPHCSIRPEPVVHDATAARVCLCGWQLVRGSPLACACTLHTYKPLLLLLFCCHLVVSRANNKNHIMSFALSRPFYTRTPGDAANNGGWSTNERTGGQHI